MNGLSWLLYWAEVGDGLKIAMTFGVSLVTVVATIGGFAWMGLGGETWSWDSEETKAFKKGLPARIWGVLPRIWIVAAILFMVGMFVPSRNTIMLIAASEVGETILATDAAKEIGGEAGEIATDSLKLLRKYITEQLGETETAKD